MSTQYYVKCEKRGAVANGKDIGARPAGDVTVQEFG